jgi:hypothetical protein
MRFFVHAPTDGVPPLGAVLTPNLTRTSVGYGSRGRVYGQPGTQAVRIYSREGLSFGKNDLANVGTFFSKCAPDVIYPPLYWEAGNAYGDHEHAPVSRISDNQMPAPAIRAPNVLVFKPYKARKGGQRQVYQPQVVQSWRGMKGTANG